MPTPACHCFPRINVRAAVRPFADRIVWIGDSGVNRLFKDGIGSAYRTAKAAARLFPSPARVVRKYMALVMG